MRRLLLGLAALLALAGGAHAQSCSGTPNANQVCAGPSSGGAGFPSFRAEVNADLPTSPANTVKGSIAGGAPADLTATQLTTLCNTVTASLSGCVPSFPNNTTTFFRGDGTYGNLTSGAFDAAFGSTRGSILERAASGWQIVTPGTSGLAWVSNGAAADPAYEALTGTALAVPFTQTLAISANQATVSGFGYNPISIGIRTSSDNASCTCPTPGQNIPTLLTVEETFGGSSINNGRNGISSNLQMTAATSATNPYRFYVALNALADMQNGDGGTAGTPLGEIEAVTGATILQGTSTNVRNMTGAEFSLSANSGSSVAQKAVLTLDTFPTDAVHGATNGAITGIDTFIWSFSEGVSFNTWAQIDLTGGVAPIATTGSVLKLIGSYTITNGLDFGGLTISGNVLQWASSAWSLNGSGGATLNFVSAQTLSSPTIIQTGHVRVGASPPTLSSCGTSPTISGSDVAGLITTGTGTPSACTLTFASAYVSTPNCVITSQTPSLLTSWVTANTGIAINTTATSNVKLNYRCDAQNGG